jgi:ABC-2 type transport system ATP-binding protein
MQNLADPSVSPADAALPKPALRSGNHVVVTQKLGRRYGEVIAAADIELRVAPGEMLALIGPNGAGKSTVMKMLTTLLSPTEGEAQVAGYDVRR